MSSPSAKILHPDIKPENAPELASASRALAHSQ